jgi:hypothetical protein
MADFIRFTSDLAGDESEQELIRFLYGPFPTKERMLKAANNQIERIQARTAQGLDTNGHPFAPYALSTARARARKGLSTTPNLRVTGAMLDAMIPEVRSETEFGIVFADDTQEAIAASLERGTERVPARDFFNTSEQELDLIFEDLTEEERNPDAH